MIKRSEIKGRADKAVESIAEEAGKVFDEVMEKLGNAANRELAKDERPTPGSRRDAGPRMGEGFERIVELVFDASDPEAEYVDLEASLQLGEKRTDFGSLVKALDEAEDNARRAHKLWCKAKVEQVRFDRDFDVFKAPIWATATAKLQEEKDRGRRSKAITEQDVEMKCAEHYPEDFRRHAVRAEQVKLMVKHAEEIAGLWKGRCSTLRTLLEQRRR